MPVLTAEYATITFDNPDVDPNGFTGTIKNVRITVEETEIENSAQGDGWESSRHLRNRWSGTAERELPEDDTYGTYAFAVGIVTGFAMFPEGLSPSALVPGPIFAGLCRIRRVELTGDTSGEFTEPLEIRGVGAPTFINGSAF